MREIRTQIEIDASPRAIWNILTDFSKFPEWNPLMRVEGVPREGSRIRLRVGPPGKKPMEFKPTVTRVVQDQELRWLGRLIIPGLFDGEHIFEIDGTNEGGVQFVHREIFSGLLVPLFWKRLDSEIREGFMSMNKALKARAEGSKGDG